MKYHNLINILVTNLNNHYECVILYVLYNLGSPTTIKYFH